MALATKNKTSVLLLARSIAEQLGQNGPVSMNEVNRKLLEMGYDLYSKNKGKDNWKGSVFKDGKWVRVGEVMSVSATSHGKYIGLWALKTWLQTKNGFNGLKLNISAMSIPSILQQHIQKYKDLGNDTNIWLLGTNKLSEEFFYAATIGGEKVIRVEGTGGILLRKSDIPKLLKLCKENKLSFMQRIKAFLYKLFKKSTKTDKVIQNDQTS